MARAEMEFNLVLNAADCDDDFLLASSTWPRWTRFLDRLVSDGLASCQDIHDQDGHRIGGNYRVRAGAITVVRKRKLSAAALEARRQAAAKINSARKNSQRARSSDVRNVQVAEGDSRAMTVRAEPREEQPK